MFKDLRQKYKIANDYMIIKQPENKVDFYKGLHFYIVNYYSY